MGKIIAFMTLTGGALVIWSMFGAQINKLFMVSGSFILVTALVLFIRELLSLSK